MKASKPKYLKTGHKGVKWFLVEDKSQIETPKGNYKKVEPGIYLEDIGVRKR